MPTLRLERQFKVIRRHPELILHFYEGKPALMKRLATAELVWAKAEYQQFQDLSLEELIRFYYLNSCYHTSYLYAICKKEKPRLVVETGVNFGFSSAFILKALQENSAGHLYSIDLPHSEYRREGNGQLHVDSLPKGEETGFVIPAAIRSSWDLILGDAKEKLPELLAYLDSIDLFHHDSLHTYEHMTFELNLVWPKLEAGGLIICDDADWNEAFVDFCRSKRVKGQMIGPIGLVKK